MYICSRYSETETDHWRCSKPISDRTSEVLQPKRLAIIMLFSLFVRNESPFWIPCIQSCFMYYFYYCFCCCSLKIKTKIIIREQVANLKDFKTVFTSKTHKSSVFLAVFGLLTDSVPLWCCINCTSEWNKCMIV